MEKLNSFQMKLVYVVTSLVAVFGSTLLIIGMWMCFTNKSEFPSALFPILWGSVGLYNVYKIIMCMKSGEGHITSRQVRGRFFSYTRGTLACMAYIFWVGHDLKNTAAMVIFTIIVFCGELFINHLEKKKLKTGE